MDERAASLTISRLTKRFGARVALDGLDLRVERGEVFGLLGPNGAGKTTAVRLICGFISPDAGELRVEGAPGSTGARGEAPNSGELRRLVGVCPQELVIWELLTCLEQLVFVAEMYGHRSRPARARALELLDALGLADRAHVRAGTLSGGMKRRLNLLLALAHDPSIVLLDEPEAGLDPRSRVLVRDFVKALGRRKTVILTSHSMDEVDRVADRVGILNEGRLLVVDTPANLKRTSGDGDALHIEIEPCEEALRQAGLRALQGLSAGRAPVAVELDARGFRVRCPRAVDLVADAVNALRALGIGVGSLTIRENTLEDAFIALTGRSLASEDAQPVP
jgi:ABC-2 type transport system ATP-binding protein